MAEGGAAIMKFLSPHTITAFISDLGKLVRSDPKLIQQIKRS